MKKNADILDCEQIDPAVGWEPAAAHHGRRPPLRVHRGASTRLAAALARIAPGDSAAVSAGGSQASMNAQVVEVLYRGISLLMDEFLAPGTATETLFTGDIAVFGEVGRCQPRGAMFYSRFLLFDARLHGPDRRTRDDERFPVEIAATMRLAHRTATVSTVEIVDVSRAGLRIRAERGLAQGTQVRIQCHGASISGEVRYSRQVALDEFYIGIQAVSVSGGASVGGEIDLTQLRDLE
jgi:PilZ domain